MITYHESQAGRFAGCRKIHVSCETTEEREKVIVALERAGWKHARRQFPSPGPINPHGSLAGIAKLRRELETVGAKPGLSH